MIKIDPVEFDNFTMSHVSDEENGFTGVVAISNKQFTTMPLVEIKFESYNSPNQQIDITKKYAYLFSNPLYLHIKAPSLTLKEYFSKK